MPRRNRLMKRWAARHLAPRQRRAPGFALEVLESRLLLSTMPLTVEITRFETLPGNFPDTTPPASFFAEITIADQPVHTTTRIDDSDGDFIVPADRRDNWSLTRQVDTNRGRVRAIIHVIDFDTGLEGENDEMDVNPLSGRRGELTIFVDPLTGAVENEDGTPFARDFPGLQGIEPTFGFFSTGRDDPNQGQVFFELRLGAANADNDGDALLDTWETWGIDASNPFGPADLTRQPDLRLPGADPDHKDIYVEVDAMLGLVPQAQALANVRNAFADVPNALVNNPDGQPGIDLHFEEGASPGDLLDEANIPRATWGAVDASNWPTGFDAIKNPTTISPTGAVVPNPGAAGGFGTLAERTGANAANVLAAKRLAYRYAIFGDQYAQRDAAGVVALTTSSGLAEQPGNDFMVTLGSWPVAGGTLDQQAGTFMHELGHTLGLDHGGGDPVNWKPNYHSVMSYTWQVPTVAPAGATPQQVAFQNSWTLDYSRQAFVIPTTTALLEGLLDEGNGIGGHAGHVVQVGPVLDAAGNPVAPGFVNESGPIDWDGSGTPNIPTRDVNFLGDTNGDGNVTLADASPGETLQPFEDWSKLRYNFRNTGGFADGAHPEIASTELTREAFIRFSDRIAPQSTLSIGSPQYPVGAAQPFVTGATPFSLSATDDASGVHSVSYRFFLQGGPPSSFTRVIGASTQFTLSGPDGTYQVETLATDQAGNIEAAHVRLVGLDNTAPVIAINQPAATEYAHSAILILDYTVDDGAGSGVSAFVPTVDSATTLAGHGLASGQSIALLTELSLGPHTFAIAATDNLLNRSQAVVTFEIIVTPESIKEDVAFFRASGDIEKDGLARSLLAKLNAAAAALGRGQGPTAVNIYEAFINQLNAQGGKGVTATAAAIMIADAEYLIANYARFLPLAPASAPRGLAADPAGGGAATTIAWGEARDARESLLTILETSWPPSVQLPWGSSAATPVRGAEAAPVPSADGAADRWLRALGTFAARAAAIRTPGDRSVSGDVLAPKLSSEGEMADLREHPRGGPAVHLG